MRLLLLAALEILVITNTATAETLRLRLTWGHRMPQAEGFYVALRGDGVEVSTVKGIGLEETDSSKEGVIEGRAGGGDVDGLECQLDYPVAQPREIANLNNIWRDLIAQSDADTASRLQNDPAFRRDDRRVTVQMNREGTQGFTLSVDQLLNHRAFWVPSLDIFVAAGNDAPSFAQHAAKLEAWKGKRILDQVRAEEEASLAQFTARWEDMGSSAYKHNSQPAPGHIVCLAWPGALHKFGVDRGAGVWNDYGNADKFRLDFDFGRLNAELTRTWRGQKLTDGLPVVVTTIERDQIRYEVEQFAYPLDGPMAAPRGDLTMVLLQKVRITNLTSKSRDLSFQISHQRQLTDNAALQGQSVGEGVFLCEESRNKAIALSLQGKNVRLSAQQQQLPPAGAKLQAARSLDLAALMTLPPDGVREVVIKLPSPVVPATDCNKLLAIDYAAARAVTLKFWSNCLSQGATFSVPEPAVNELFRANLWHAMRLPRRHDSQGPDVRIDLPYSNFAYDQNNIPWPINQAVYVDYMLYDLRGHHAMSAEELLAMFRVNQEKNGRVNGFANWVVYTPGMIYAVAQHYLLSGDRESFDRLLPPTLRASDWCLEEIRKAKEGPNGDGLVRGPLNDLSGDGVWAFNQAYIYAGLDLLATALQRAGHPRSAEMRQAAGALRRSIEQSFAVAAVRSPLVQLRDHTWTPYVPCEARSSGRRLDQWYPTDVDTGAMHLPRLKAIDPNGRLSTAMLHDHEDNLYLKGWGMANEPVYNPQATVYLLRDEPKAAIRAFYSYIACGFSHSALEPVEHRWTHGQYFGPPSTDGAWFELYRRMLIQERDNDTLLLLAATPRKWLGDGQRIEVQRAPTYFGLLDMLIESHVAAGQIRVLVQCPQRQRPQELIVRLRHPRAKRIAAVTVNGDRWDQFDADKEWVRIAKPDQARYDILVYY